MAPRFIVYLASTETMYSFLCESGSFAIGYHFSKCCLCRYLALEWIASRHPLSYNHNPPSPSHVPNRYQTPRKLTTIIPALSVPCMQLLTAGCENNVGWICYKLVSKAFINTNVPIVRHHIASQTEENIKEQAEINLSGHFLHSWFELTGGEIG